MNDLLDWLYGQVVGFLGDFFGQMGSMGVELFDLEWVQAVILFFSRLAWALFAVSGLLSAALSMPAAGPICSRQLWT